MDNKFKYVEFMIGLAAMLISVGVCYGILQTRIGTLENASLNNKSDHDLLISIATKIENMQKDITELKVDCKEMNAKIK
jgi:hypothetical protein